MQLTADTKIAVQWGSFQCFQINKLPPQSGLCWNYLVGAVFCPPHCLKRPPLLSHKPLLPCLTTWRDQIVHIRGSDVHLVPCLTIWYRAHEGAGQSAPWLQSEDCTSKWSASAPLTHEALFPAAIQQPPHTHPVTSSSVEPSVIQLMIC